MESCSAPEDLEFISASSKLFNLWYLVINEREKKRN